MRRRRMTSFGQEESNQQVTLWILRVLVQLGTLRKFVTEHGLEDRNLARYLNVEDLEDYSKTFDSLVARKKIVNLHTKTESDSYRSGISPTFLTNLKRLSKLLDLSGTDEQVLEFAVALQMFPALSYVTSYLGTISPMDIIRGLAIILGIEQSALKRSLHPDSILAKSGLVKLDRRAGRFDGSFDLLSSGFAERMMMDEIDPVELIRDVVYPSSEPSLGLGDYTHIQDTLVVLCPYLGKAVEGRRAGVNVFIYGPPGTGKTELAKVLAHEIGCELYEVTCEDNDSEAANSSERMKAFNAAQNFFVQRQAMILFDEVESIFERDHTLGGANAALERKAWLNRTLETNRLPTIWISNSVYIDRAFLRRFDMVFEIPVPPRAQRQEIIRKNCDGLLREDAIRRIAEPERLAPALITRSSSVIKAISGEIGKDKVSGAIESLINSSLRAQGHQTISKPDAFDALKYDPGFINANVNPESLVASIRESQAGRICFYGPSGTGKTAFARWLAYETGVSLIVKRGSDLISPFIGETEKSIARAFADARDTRSALLIDEFDTFLQDRRSAQRSWEISQINEVLVQLEDFQGLFIATTNRLEAVDPAALRRLDMKLEFGFLSSDQALTLFRRHCELLKLEEPSREIARELGRLITLTVGDFAVMSRQSRLNRIVSAEMLLVKLREECSFREEGKRPIGFLNRLS